MHAHVCSALYWYQLWGNNDLCVNPTSLDMAEEANEWYDSVALHCRKDVFAHGIMNWNMVWKIDWTGECIQLHVTGTAQCTLNYLAYLECCHLTAGALWASLVLSTGFLFKGATSGLVTDYNYPQARCDGEELWRSILTDNSLSMSAQESVMAIRLPSDTAHTCSQKYEVSDGTWWSGGEVPWQGARGTEGIGSIQAFFLSGGPCQPIWGHSEGWPRKMETYPRPLLPTWKQWIAKELCSFSYVTVDDIAT